MTNAEKFKEVFGIKLGTFPADPCNIVDRTYHECLKTSCADCEFNNFWDKEYNKEVTEDDNN